MHVLFVTGEPPNSIQRATSIQRSHTPPGSSPPTVTTALGPAVRGRGIEESLASAVRGLGHQVTLVAPMTQSVDPAALPFARRLRKIAAVLPGPAGDSMRGAMCERYDARTAAGIDLVLLAVEGAQHEPGALFDSGDRETVQRRVASFAGGVLGLISTLDPVADVIHGFDAVGALVLAAMKHGSGTALAAPAATVWSWTGSQRGMAAATGAEGFDAGQRLAATIAADEAVLRELALVLASDAPPKVPSVILWATESADLITSATPLPTRLGTRNDASGSEGPQVLSISSGIDPSVWSPATDPALVSRFDPVNLTGKNLCKSAVQAEMGFEPRDDAPVVLVVGDREREWEAFAAAAPEILQNDCQLIVLHSPDAPASESLSPIAKLMEAFTDRLVIAPRASNPGLVESAAKPLSLSASSPTLHRWMAAADLLLLLGDQAPWAMVGHRYGVLPVAPHSGESGDALVDCDPTLASGTAFLFDPADSATLLGTARRALSAFRSHGFLPLRRRVMRIDHSWERTARRFEQQYRSLVARPAGTPDHRRESPESAESLPSPA